MAKYGSLMSVTKTVTVDVDVDVDVELDDIIGDIDTDDLINELEWRGISIDPEPEVEEIEVPIFNREEILLLLDMLEPLPYHWERANIIDKLKELR
jgi:hypothetical protein